jgi:phosphohistidine phosphatase
LGEGHLKDVRRLILFRHARAAGRAVGITDQARPLDAEGRLDAAASGRWMAAHGLNPDVVLVSPSLRTRQTWDCVQALFPGARVEFPDQLYQGGPEDIEASLGATAADAEVVLVIGHNPGLQELAVDFLAGGTASADDVDKVSGGFPTATVAVFDVGDDGRATLGALFNPRRDSPPPFVEVWDDDAGSAS